jgi:hypothetical protein
MTKAKERLQEELAVLKRKLLETEAQLVHVYHFAHHGILKADTKRTLGSGILVRLNYLGGAEVCLPFVVKDGFSDETISALHEDISRSYDKTIEFRP